MKKEKNFQIESDSVMENGIDLHLDGVDTTEKHLEYLQEAIQTLNEEQKRCIEMFYIEEKSYKEIVDETGFSEMKVKSYIQNGKRNLKIKILSMTSIILLFFYLFITD